MNYSDDMGTEPHSFKLIKLRPDVVVGYGYRKKAYGYDWLFTSEIEAKECGLTLRSSGDARFCTVP